MVAQSFFLLFSLLGVGKNEAKCAMNSIEGIDFFAFEAELTILLVRKELINSFRRKIHINNLFLELKSGLSDE